MNNTKSKTWYSGDWKKHNNEQIPYNGVKITATATYSLPTKPPFPQKLVSVDAVIVDYTKDANGVSSEVKLTKTGLSYDISIPEKKSVSPKHPTKHILIPNANFTIANIHTSGLGKLQLDVVSTGICLYIQFSYGETNNSKTEVGFIFEFNETYLKGEDAAKVAGK